MDVLTCLQFLINPKRDPLTGKDLSENSPLFHKYQRECQQRHLEDIMFSESFFTNVLLHLATTDILTMCHLNHHWRDFCDQQEDLWMYIIRRDFHETQKPTNLSWKQYFQKLWAIRQKYPTRYQSKPDVMSWDHFREELDLRHDRAKSFEVKLSDFLDRLDWEPEEKADVLDYPSLIWDFFDKPEKIADVITQVIQQNPKYDSIRDHVLRGDAIWLADKSEHDDDDNHGRFFWDGQKVIPSQCLDIEDTGLIPDDFLVPTEFPIQYFKSVERESPYVASDLGRHKEELIQTLTEGSLTEGLEAIYATFHEGKITYYVIFIPDEENTSFESNDQKTFRHVSFMKEIRDHLKSLTDQPVTIISEDSSYDIPQSLHNRVMFLDHYMIGSSGFDAIHWRRWR